MVTGRAVDYLQPPSAEEVDAEIAGNTAAAEEAERLWKRGQRLLAG